MRNFFLLFLFLSLLIVNATSLAFTNEQGDLFKYEEIEPLQFAGILASHNKVRKKFKQHPLVWSDSLANYAQKWVNRLAETQNCKMLHRPNYKGEHESENYLQVHGENLFWASPEVFPDGRSIIQSFTPKQVVKLWAIEEEHYDYQSNTCKPGQQCGHFTQMVWHESRQVGCAKAICPDKSQIWACNYHPRGNYIGEKPY